MIYQLFIAIAVLSVVSAKSSSKSPTVVPTPSPTAVYVKDWTGVCTTPVKNQVQKN
jgi:hypothetical protein